MSESYRHKPQYERVKFLAKNSCQTPQSSATLTHSDGGGRKAAISPALAAALSPGMSTKDGKLGGLGGTLDLFNPQKILILIGTILLLLFLLFLGQRSAKRRWSSTIDTVSQNLKQLGQQQQVLLKAQQNQLELAQTNSMRTDELRQLLGQDFRQTLAMIMSQPSTLLASVTPVTLPVQGVVSLPVPGTTVVPKFTTLSIPTVTEESLPLPCQDDGSGACQEFKRRQSALEGRQADGASGVNVLQPPVVTSTSVTPAQAHPSTIQGGMLPKLLSAMPNFSGARSRNFT